MCIQAVADPRGPLFPNVHFNPLATAGDVNNKSSSARLPRSYVWARALNLANEGSAEVPEADRLIFKIEGKAIYGENPLPFLQPGTQT